MTAALFLWMMEAIWKGFQYCNTDRIKAIEAFFRGEESEDFKPFQIFTSWGEVYDRHFRKPSSLIPILLQPFVFLPYLPTIFLGAIILAVT